MPIATRPIPFISESYKERFWGRVDKDGPIIYGGIGKCWVWTAGKGADGYGRFHIGKKGFPCSRISWALSHGEIGDGDLVLHKCDNPICVNPGHLFVGTPKDNTQDKVRKGRGNNPSGDRHWSRRNPEKMSRGDKHYTRTNPERILKGERNGAAKLTDEKVRQLRLRRSGGATISSLAKEFKIGQEVCRRAIIGWTWRHVI